MRPHIRRIVTSDSEASASDRDVSASASDDDDDLPLSSLLSALSVTAPKVKQTAVDDVDTSTSIPASAASPTAELDDTHVVGSECKNHCSASIYEVSPDVSLRDYQAELLAEADRLFESHRAVLAYLPTGGGKTRVGAAAMSKWALSSSSTSRCLFLVNRRTLLQRTRDSLMELGFAAEAIHLISAETHHERAAAVSSAAASDRARVHVAMVQSLHERYRAAHSFADYSLAVIDECHAAAAPTYLALLGAL